MRGGGGQAWGSASPSSEMMEVGDAMISLIDSSKVPVSVVIRNTLTNCRWKNSTDIQNKQRERGRERGRGRERERDGDES